MQAINTALNRAPLVEAHCASLEAQAAVDPLQSLYQPCQPYLRSRRFGPPPSTEAQTNNITTPSTISPQVPANNTTGPALPTEAQMNDTIAPLTSFPQAPDNNVTSPILPTEAQNDITPSTIHPPQAVTLSHNDSMSTLLTALFYLIEQSHRTEAVPTHLNHHT